MSEKRGFFGLDYTECDTLVDAMMAYQGNVERAINEVFHNEVGDLAQGEIHRLMPVSGKRWKGKKPAAKTSKSLRNVNGNLSVTVTTKKNWQYLYFPDDGTSTRRHVGNQQFFRRGGENVSDEIIERCITKLTTDFEKGV